jgi:hypothetical protein
MGEHLSVLMQREEGQSKGGVGQQRIDAQQKTHMTRIRKDSLALRDTAPKEFGTKIILATHRGPTPDSTRSQTWQIYMGSVSKNGSLRCNQNQLIEIRFLLRFGSLPPVFCHVQESYALNNRLH